MVERECTLERGAGAPDVLEPVNPAPMPPPLPGKGLAAKEPDTPKVEYWKLDGRKLGFGEWMQIVGGWGAVVGWTTKLLGINIVGACRVPKFDDSSQLRVEEVQIREEVLGKMRPFMEEFRALGFHTPLYIRMENFFNGCEVIRATLLHPNAQTLAQVSLCLPFRGTK